MGTKGYKLILNSCGTFSCIVRMNDIMGTKGYTTHSQFLWNFFVYRTNE